MAALLERFYEPQEGVVKLDGQALCTLDPSWLRGEVVGYISQEPVLFGCSVMENIRYGNPAATDDQVKEAAALAYADQFIQEFPDGYDTLVGERGLALSGGQKQRSGVNWGCAVETVQVRKLSGGHLGEGGGVSYKELTLFSG